jgi:hypothetical protein
VPRSVDCRLWLVERGEVGLDQLGLGTAELGVLGEGGAVVPPGAGVVAAGVQGASEAGVGGGLLVGGVDVGGHGEGGGVLSEGAGGLAGGAGGVTEPVEGGAFPCR